MGLVSSETAMVARSALGLRNMHNMHDVSRIHEMDNDRHTHNVMRDMRFTHDMNMHTARHVSNWAPQTLCLGETGPVKWLRVCVLQ